MRSFTRSTFFCWIHRLDTLVFGLVLRPVPRKQGNAQHVRTATGDDSSAKQLLRNFVCALRFLAMKGVNSETSEQPRHQSGDSKRALNRREMFLSTTIRALTSIEFKHGKPRDRHAAAKSTRRASHFRAGLPYRSQTKRARQFKTGPGSRCLWLVGSTPVASSRRGGTLAAAKQCGNSCPTQKGLSGGPPPCPIAQPGSRRRPSHGIRPSRRYGL
jgi:hypothetical protein